MGFASYGIGQFKDGDTLRESIYRADHPMGAFLHYDDTTVVYDGIADEDLDAFKTWVKNVFEECHDNAVFEVIGDRLQDMYLDCEDVG